MQTIEEVLNMTRVRLLRDYLSRNHFLTNLKAFCQEISCWIVGNVVSIEVGKDDWSYTPCKTCPKKVEQNKDRDNVLLRCSCKYQLQIIVTDGSGCMKLLLWNKEKEQMMGKASVKFKELCKWKKTKSYPKYLENIVDKRFLFKLNITYKNINAMDGMYIVTKLSDDKCLLSSFSCANLLMLLILLLRAIATAPIRLQLRDLALMHVMAP
ncbi:hypothetical protein AHAS_Ahas20G0247500 [Arachis hypogaea]